METWIQWAGGIGISILTGLVAFMANAHTQLSRKQSSDVATLHSKLEEVKRDYVRRDDFREFKEDVKESLARIEEKQDKLISIARSH